MILHQSSHHNYRDKLGKRRLFRSSIDHYGVEMNGPSWTGPLSSHEPTIISAIRTTLDSPDVDYAIDIILYFRQKTDMKWIQFESNDSIPTGCNIPHMFISFEDWNFAHRKSIEIHGEQLKIHEQVHELLDRFSILALTSKIMCYAQDRTTLRLKPIRPEDWNVGKDVLWSRYTSETIDIKYPANCTHNGHYIISVDEQRLQEISFLKSISKEDRLIDIKKRLIEAVALYPEIAPQGGAKMLLRDLCAYLEMKKDEVRNIICEIPGHHWFEQGRPTNAANRPKNDFRITPKKHYNQF